MEQTAHMQNLKSKSKMKMKSLMINWMGTLSHQVTGESYVIGADKMPILTKELTIKRFDMLYVIKWDKPVVYPFWIFWSQEMSLIDIESFQRRIGVGRPLFWISNSGLKLCKQSVLCTQLWKMNFGLLYKIL